MVMLEVQIEQLNSNLLMFQKWIIFQLTIHLEDKFATEETLFLKGITSMKRIPNKQLMRKVGITVETLELSCQMELWKLLTERKIFTNWVKDNMLLHKRFKISIWDVLMLLNVSFMVILYKTVTSLLSTQTSILSLLLQKSLVLMKLTLKIWSKIKK